MRTGALVHYNMLLVQDRSASIVEISGPSVPSTALVPSKPVRLPHGHVCVQARETHGPSHETVLASLSGFYVKHNAVIHQGGRLALDLVGTRKACTQTATA